MFANLSRRRIRELREYLTAYFMITPALILIFVFGIFPVLFAVYVSLHKWKIRQGDFIGLKNYVTAIDNLAFLLFFATALGFLFIAYQNLSKAREDAKEQGNARWWVWLIPSFVHAASWLLFLRWVVYVLPEVLEIAVKVRNLERTRELFMGLLRDALNAELVAPAGRQFVWVFVGAWVVTAVFDFVRTKNWSGLLGKLSSFWFFLSAGLITGWYTYTKVMEAIAVAFETGEEANSGVQVVLIAAGLVTLLAAWKLWGRAVNSEGDRNFALQGFAALLLIVAGWLLIAEIPAVIQAGDEDLWEGLKVTIFYALGTIPFQLSISLMLAFILFQRVRGKEFFRMMFFLPYVTPAVASASVFRLLFSAKSGGFVNSWIVRFGMESQRWLQEPRGVFALMTKNWGVEIPDWANGPSLALVVIIIYSIWTYVGYDTVIYLAGLGNISFELNEAASIDGANRWQIFRYITLPLLSPTTYFLSMLAVIGTFKAFNHIFVMRDALAIGTVDTMSVAIFDEFFVKTRYGYASSMAFILFAIILMLTYVNNKVQGSRVFYG